jgi:hypothetical protein
MVSSRIVTALKGEEMTSTHWRICIYIWGLIAIRSCEGLEWGDPHWIFGCIAFELLREILTSIQKEYLMPHGRVLTRNYSTESS